MNNNHLFFDMDGTLLNSNNEILQENINAIKKAKESNIAVSIATGRSINMTIKYINDLQIIDPVVLANGNFIYLPLERKIKVLGKDLNKSVKSYVVEYLKRVGGTITWFSEKKDYVYSNINESSYIDEYSTNVLDLSSLSIDELEAFLLSNNVYHLSLAYVGKGIQDDKTFEQLTEEFRILEKLNLCKVSSNSNKFIDCDNIGINKEVAINYLVKTTNIDPNKIYVFGDSNNDLPMFKKYKNSVAMGNAIADLKTIAKYTIEDHNTPGIANFLQKEFKI